MNTIPTFFVLSLVLMYLVGWTRSGVRRMLGATCRSVSEEDDPSIR